MATTDCTTHPDPVFRLFDRHSSASAGECSLKCFADELALQTLQRNGSIDAIRTAVKQGRPKCTDIVPGSPLRHFLYKSRGNVQFTMPSFEPYFEGALEKRR
jgi:hypothetical protein